MINQNKASNKTKKIAKNTILLYLRMVFVVILNLITIRLIYKSLGTDYYGIYNVIIGIVLIFQSFSSVLSTSTQRFYSYAIGGKMPHPFSNVYSTSVKIYARLSIK